MEAFARRLPSSYILPGWRSKTEDLQDPGPIPESGDNAFKIAIRKLDSYFRVEENIPYERHVFRQLAPKEEETADQFMVSLKKTGATLRFWDEFKR